MAEAYKDWLKFEPKEEEIVNQKQNLPISYFLENQKQILSQFTQEAKQGQEEITPKSENNTSNSSLRHELIENEFHSNAFDSFTIRQMMLAGMHLGHAVEHTGFRMSPFIYGVRNGINIIDLDQSIFCLRLASNVVRDLAHSKILFIGTRPFISDLCYKTATKCNKYYINNKYTKGTLTNRKSVLKADILPDLIIVLDYHNNYAAIEEANILNIPSIAICDSDCDPEKVTWPIPANDDAFLSVQLVCDVLCKSIMEGKANQGFFQNVSKRFQGRK